MPAEELAEALARAGARTANGKP